MQIFAHSQSDMTQPDLRPDPVLWALRPGDCINRWLLTAPRSEIFAGIARPHPDQMDYRFVNGWVETGDLPCREALRAALPGLAPRLADDGEFSEIYFGEENPRVDFTTFCFQPTRIGRWARALVQTATAQSVGFEAITCGIMHIWLDGRKVLVHQPLDRNIPHAARFSLALQQGINEITVYLEDLHERDTSCFFELRLVEGDGLQAGIRADIPANSLRDAENVLQALRTTRLFFPGETLSVVCDHTPVEPVSVVFHSGQMSASGSTMNVMLDHLPMPGGPVEFTVSKAGEQHELIETTGIDAGCYGLVFSIQIGAIQLNKVIGTSILGNGTRISAQSLDARKAGARGLIASEQGQEQSISRALLLLEEQSDPQAVETIFRRTLTAINGRYDCADFWILPLIWAWRRHAGTQLPAPLWDEVKEAILGFRYWLDEPGNDVMWFWSENHALCFHVAQYLAGDAFEAEVFFNSGKTGAEHRQQARDRLERWFDATDRHGLAEWNSAAYYPIDLLGLLTLYQNCTDAKLKERAERLIDRIFSMVALHSVDGMPVGTQGRVYEKELFAGPATELAAVAAIAFGGIWCSGHERAAALFAISDYNPPRDLEKLHRLVGIKQLEARYTQGLDENARLCLWKSADAQLSSVSGHRTGDKGHQQHVADIQFSAHPLARIWINHPGELKIWGGGRPSYWMGNGVIPRVTQTKNLCALIYDLNRHDHPINFIHIFVPAEIVDELRLEQHWLFVRSGQGYAAIWCSSPLQPHRTGLYAGSEWRGDGPKTAWLMLAGSEATYGGFDAFRSAALASEPGFDVNSLSVDYRIEGDNWRTTFEHGLMHEGKIVPFTPASILPHVSLDGDPLAIWSPDVLEPSH